MSHLWREHELSRNWKRFLVIVNVATALALTLYSTAISLPVNNLGTQATLREKITVFVDEKVPFWVVISVVGVFVVTGIIVRVADHRWNPQTPYVRAALEALQIDLWSQPPATLDGSDHRHRITLFQAQRRNWFVKRFTEDKHSHRLVPRARLPRGLGRDPQKIWLCDHHHGNLCTGIAGQVYASNTSLATSPLPDLANGGSKKKYAKMTNDMEREETIYSRVIGGIPLMSSSGGRWGVLVLDSCDPHAIDPNKWEETSVQEKVKILSSNLPEAKS